jgi:hypothetical protein
MTEIHTSASGPTEAEVAPFAAMVLAGVHREYPNQLHHHLSGDEEVRPPRELTPAFFGCYDWHSAVHGHWCLTRLLHLYPGASFAAQARAALARSLTPEHIAGEVAYQSAPGRQGFERPYGLAWLLQLAAELREWEDAAARRWLEALLPLEALAVERLSAWLPKLRWPIRSGEHSQTALALGLAWDWARAARHSGLTRLVEGRARDFHGRDTRAPLAYEPSGQDFLSPILAEADLMRRVLTGEEFAAWLRGFLPDLEGAEAREWLTPAGSSDQGDGKLAHLDGLNLSRAWMLEGIGRTLAGADPRRTLLLDAAQRHRRAGLAGAASPHYAGTHWLGTFAVYLLTGRGLARGGA